MRINLPGERSQHGYFAKGSSFNPGGRPAIEKDVIALARENSLESIRTLVEIRDDITAPHGVRVFAANSILDRAVGKVKEFVDGDPERIDMVQALMTALRVSGAVRTQRRITLDVDASDDE